MCTPSTTALPQPTTAINADLVLKLGVDRVRWERSFAISAAAEVMLGCPGGMWE